MKECDVLGSSKHTRTLLHIFRGSVPQPPWSAPLVRPIATKLMVWWPICSMFRVDHDPERNEVRHQRRSLITKLFRDTYRRSDMTRTTRFCTVTSSMKGNVLKDPTRRPTKQYVGSGGG